MILIIVFCTENLKYCSTCQYESVYQNVSWKWSNVSGEFNLIVNDYKRDFYGI